MVGASVEVLKGEVLKAGKQGGKDVGAVSKPTRTATPAKSVLPAIQRLNLLPFNNWKALHYLILLSFTTWGCTTETTTYQVEPIEVGVNDEAKVRAKQSRQFIQALYNQVYQRALPPSEAVALDEFMRSIGDRQVAIELVVAKMVSDTAARLPDTQLLAGDPETFIGQLYRRFYVRDATQAELSWWVNYLETHPEVDVASVVFAFVTAEEYRYY